MKVVIVFEFADVTDSNSPEADLIMEELGADTEGWRLDTGATAVYIEESFDSEQENQEIDLDDDMNDNHKKASAIYEAKGQFAVHDAAKDGTLSVDRWVHCVPCEIESPIEDDACLVCGTLSRKK